MFQAAALDVLKLNTQSLLTQWMSSLSEFVPLVSSTPVSLNLLSFRQFQKQRVQREKD